VNGGPRAVYALDPWMLPPVVWGGFELQERFGKRGAAGARLGESWEVSCVPGREARIRGTGATLAAAVDAAPGHFLGARKGGANAFPLLVKLLCTAAPLSVQVHPSDEQARRLEGSPTGKHEAWVVLAAGPASAVWAGLRPGAAAAELFDAAAAGDAERVRSLLVRHPVAVGDAVEIPPGCVHAPGPDLVLWEVQQPVDLTYRIFDWGRVGLDGRPRPLHAEKAREVVDDRVRPRVRKPAPASVAGGLSREPVLETRPFAVERWRVGGRARADAGSLLLVTCAAGRGAIEAGGETVALDPGQSCVVPASTAEVSIEGEGLELLVATRS
jgi:mannose-6-phosphate isomerase